MRYIHRRQARTERAIGVFARGGGAPKLGRDGHVVSTCHVVEPSGQIAVPDKLYKVYNEVLTLRLIEARYKRLEQRQAKRKAQGLGGSRQHRRLGRL